MTGRPNPPASEVAYLASLLRDLKQRTGLSLVGLAAETPFSKSSWNRYLNGSALPPRQAVEDLARLAGEPVARLLALWERAEATWSRRAASPPVTTPAPQPRRKRWPITLLATALRNWSRVRAGDVRYSATLRPSSSSQWPPRKKQRERGFSGGR
jgi:hypothetical protein